MRTSTCSGPVALNTRLPSVTGLPSFITVTWNSGSMAFPATAYGRSRKMSIFLAQRVVLTVGWSPPWPCAASARLRPVRGRRLARCAAGHCPRQVRREPVGWSPRNTRPQPAARRTAIAIAGRDHFLELSVIFKSPKTVLRNRRVGLPRWEQEPGRPYPRRQRSAKTDDLRGDRAARNHANWTPERSWRARSHS